MLLSNDIICVKHCETIGIQVLELNYIQHDIYQNNY